MRSPFPNPVTAPLATIPLELPERGDVRIGVYDVTGREVRSLHSGVLDPGSYQFRWDGKDSLLREVPSGRYYILATNERARKSQAIMVVK